MGKECWSRVSRSLCEGGNTTSLITSAWEARTRSANKARLINLSEFALRVAPTTIASEAKSYVGR